eukprot:TRINITY_DN88126_c0_g1_i1.p1 TRINITY_DN88126_c0_g1~~TRINITY_DN88126_c0_g1_i1.p1  ORF type:complete len:336 (-),score=191.27 TRINITY_DN88126_c0_g1_i1:76-1083(-)
MRVVIVIVAVLALLGSADAAPSGKFLSLGDWGGMTTGKKYDERNQQTVAKTLTAVAQQYAPEFLLNPGDNFYYYGVKSVDDTAFQTDFEDIYTDESLTVPWYSALGNHDYGYNVTAQLVYRSPRNDRWVMPARYYSKQLTVGGDVPITLIVVDTNPCIQDYRNDDPSKWDPCGSEYPGPADCRFHENILEQNCQKQMDWLKEELTKVPSDGWFIMMGHHPATELNVADFVGLLEAAPRKPDLYINGHVHTLSLYTVDGWGNFITSGAGSMVDPTNGKGHDDKKQSAQDSTHHYETVWSLKTAGFTLHTANSTHLVTDFLNGATGAVLHSFTIAKK